MPLSSIIPGRVPNSLAAQRLTQAVLRGQADLDRLQRQISSGQRFTLPSEAPTAAVRTLILQKLDERRTAFQQNIRTNQAFLGAADQSLSTIGDALVQAKGLLQSGLGNQTTDAERQALAQEARSLLRSVIQAANTQYNGRYLFAGSETGQTPFTLLGDGSVRYAGDARSLQTFADFDLLVSSGIDGAAGLRGVTTPVTSDLDPALALGTRLDQLNRGAGVAPGSIEIILDDGINEIRKTVDLANAETLNDVQTRIEAAFAAESITVTVDVDPATNFGLRLTPSAGTVEVRDVAQGRTALDLGIRSGPVAVLNGQDIDPTLSLFTTVASLNGNTGIGATAGTGLRIVNGSRISVVDLDGAATIADVLSRIRAADPDVITEISSDGTGLAVSSRLSGVDFSIGENGGTNATQLGLRTMTGSTRLGDLNHGAGVPVDSGLFLRITRRDSTEIEIDLAGAGTVQDVLDRINAFDPGNLVASLNAVGNGISLTDNSGAGALTVSANEIGVALGLDGTESTGMAGVLVGDDVNPQSAGGVFDLLSRLAAALETNDFRTLNVLAEPLEAEVARINVVRGDVGSRQQLLEKVDNQLGDAHLDLKEQLSRLFDTDLTETITAFLQQQQTLQAAMQLATTAAQLSILQFL